MFLGLAGINAQKVEHKNMIIGLIDIIIQKLNTKKWLKYETDITIEKFKHKDVSNVYNLPESTCRIKNWYDITYCNTVLAGDLNGHSTNHSRKKSFQPPFHLYEKMKDHHHYG